MPQSETKKRSSRLQLALRILVSVGLMIYLIRMIDWKEALEIIKGGSFLYIAGAFLAIQITVSSSVVKWSMLVHPTHNKTNKKDVSIHKLGRLYYVGLFFNNFLPGSVGGDLVRVVQLGKTTGISRATASVALERLTSGIALVAIVIVSSFFIKDARPYLLSLFLIVALALIVYVLFKYWVKQVDRKGAHIEKGGKVNQLLMKGKTGILTFAKDLSHYKKEQWKWWLIIGNLSLLFQFGLAWINDLLFLSFGIDIAWIELLVIITLISVITMIPVSLNGLGVREVSYVFFFQQLGVPDEISLSVSLLFFFLVSISSLVGGLFWLVERRRAA